MPSDRVRKIWLPVYKELRRCTRQINITMSNLQHVGSHFVTRFKTPRRTDRFGHLLGIDHIVECVQRARGKIDDTSCRLGYNAHDAPTNSFE